MVTRVEGQEIRTKKRVKGWVGWTPVSEGEMAKFQELVLRPRGARDEVALREAEDGEGLVHLHDRLVKAAVRDESYPRPRQGTGKFCVPEEVRQMASNAAKCKDPVRRRRLRKIAQRARREFEACKAVLPRGKVIINRPVITKLWVNWARQ